MCVRRCVVLCESKEEVCRHVPWSSVAKQVESDPVVTCTIVTSMHAYVTLPVFSIQSGIGL